MCTDQIDALVSFNSEASRKILSLSILDGGRDAEYQIELGAMYIRGSIGNQDMLWDAAHSPHAIWRPRKMNNPGPQQVVITVRQSSQMDRQIFSGSQFSRLLLIRIDDARSSCWARNRPQQRSMRPVQCRLSFHMFVIVIIQPGTPPVINEKTAVHGCSSTLESYRCVRFSLH